MSTFVIQTDGLGKKYLIEHQSRNSFPTLRDRITEIVGSAASRCLRRPGKTSANADAAQEEFWALQDLSLEIKEGEIAGIIGRNGAGKSTFLKILSRITEPTAGHVTILGRVASLLEVGTGFHPEMTGRENIYLSAAIMGMSRVEIRRQFEAIVEFAEVEQFLDTPVKRYSDGMHVRLGFAVAAHLNPDILIVDEVLAVGDALFQRKCLQKMDDITSEQGRTVLVVSHNMQTISKLCGTVYLFDAGRLSDCGPAQEIVRNYLDAVETLDTVPVSERRDRRGDGSVCVSGLAIKDADGADRIYTGARLRVEIAYRAEDGVSGLRFRLHIRDFETDLAIIRLDSRGSAGVAGRFPVEGAVACTTARIPIAPGRCNIDVLVYRHGTLADHVTHAAHFDVNLREGMPDCYNVSRDSSLLVVEQAWSNLHPTGSPVSA